MRGGDRDALRELYDRHAGWLSLRLARRCPDPELVDQALQDTFVAVWRTAKRYRGAGDVGAWLWGIAIRRLIDLLRKEGRRARPNPHRAEPLPSAEEQALAGFEHGDLGDAFRRLSPELQLVLQAVAIDGLTTKEAAALLDIPRGTVKTRLMRARQLLRDHLAAGGAP